jgi:hypothetical protein
MLNDIAMCTCLDNIQHQSSVRLVQVVGQSAVNERFLIFARLVRAASLTGIVTLRVPGFTVTFTRVLAKIGGPVAVGCNDIKHFLFFLNSFSFFFSLY